MKPLQLLAAIVAPIGLALSAAAAEPIDIGAALPAVTAKNQDGQEVKLAEAGAGGWTLVYFYPKADTPGCTKQACSLRDSYATLTEKKVKVFGVSMDDVAAQKAFQEKYKLPFPLLASLSAKSGKGREYLAANRAWDLTESPLMPSKTTPFFCSAA